MSARGVATKSGMAARRGTGRFRLRLFVAMTAVLALVTVIAVYVVQQEMEIDLRQNLGDGRCRRSRIREHLRRAVHDSILGQQERLCKKSCASDVGAETVRHFCAGTVYEMETSPEGTEEMQWALEFGRPSGTRSMLTSLTQR